MTVSDVSDRTLHASGNPPTHASNTYSSLFVRALRTTSKRILELFCSVLCHLRSDVFSIVVILLYVGASSAYLYFLGDINIDVLTGRYVSLFLSMSLAFFIPLYIVGTVVLDLYRLANGAARSSPLMGSSQFWSRLATGLVLVAMFVPMMAAYSTVKSMLPVYAGFPHEETLAAMDAFLHVEDPWRLAHALVDRDIFAGVIDLNYRLGWVFYWTGFAFWVCVSQRADHLRTRYIVSLVITWGLLGNVISSWTMSAGPVFYGNVTGDFDRFHGLTEFLGWLDANGGKVKYYSDYLWSNYQAGTVGIGSGISALPSLHVALVTLNAFFVRELFGRWWGAVAWAYVALFCFSSVYLGWHYAIDSYASIILISIIYWCGRRLSRHMLQADTKGTTVNPAKNTV